MKRNRNHDGFALPTVIITSIVMMIVLLSALTAASSVQASLRQNYYDRVARNAAESGSIYAEKCLISGNYVDNTLITPDRDCEGNPNGRSEFIVDTSDVKSTFSFRVVSIDDRTKIATIDGKAQFYGGGGYILSRTVENQLKQRFSLEQDEKEIRATQAKWYFGRRAIIDFGTSGTSNNPALNPQSSAYAGEGSTTVNDKDGNLLFWSNGITVWDKYGDAMPNGSDLNGQRSATQAVAAFPFDDQYQKFGIVSNNAVNEGRGPGQLYFSVVDMSLNGGRGDVTIKNDRMGGTNYSYEGIGAMPSNRFGEFWVYAYHTEYQRITRFRVGENGVISAPSPITMSPKAPSCNGRIGYGTFNFSADYTKMLLFAGGERCPSVGGRAYIYETDTKTGGLSLLSTWETSSNESAPRGYSADFSPSEQFVYVTELYPGRLIRYNIGDINNSYAIKQSEWVYPSEMTTAPAASGYSQTARHTQAGGQVKRGPDGRMYIADQAYNYGINLGYYSVYSIDCKMNVINNPDAASPGDIDLQIGGVSLPRRACSSFGLPQMATVFRPKIVLY